MWLPSPGATCDHPLELLSAFCFWFLVFPILLLRLYAFYLFSVCLLEMQPSPSPTASPLCLCLPLSLACALLLCYEYEKCWKHFNGTLTPRQQKQLHNNKQSDKNDAYLEIYSHPFAPGLLSAPSPLFCCLDSSQMGSFCRLFIVVCFMLLLLLYYYCCCSRRGPRQICNVLSGGSSSSYSSSLSSSSSSCSCSHFRFVMRRSQQS